MRRKPLVCILGLALGVASLTLPASADDRQAAATFDKSLHDACVDSAMRIGNSQAISDQYCTCVVDELHRVPLSQRLALSPTAPEVVAAEKTCKAKVGR